MDNAADRANPYLAHAETAPEPASHGVEELDTVECWRLLQHSSVGRFAVEGPGGIPDVFPMNYLVREGAIFVRSAPGGKLASIAKRPGIALEIDGASALHYWSVVVRGVAHRMSIDAEIESSGVLALASLSPTPKHDFLRITPSSVTGRRFARHHRTVETATTDTEDGLTSPGAVDKPEPIPHIPPLREYAHGTL